MDAQVITTGPIFNKPNLMLANIEALNEEVALVGKRLQQNLAAHRGPGRYGHVSALIRARVVPEGGDVVTGSVYPSGKGAFKALFLEKGTRPHLIMARRALRAAPAKFRRMIGQRRPGRRSATGPRALHFLAGGTPLFRAGVQHRGAHPARIFERTYQELEPQLLAIHAKHLAKVVGGD